MQIIYKDDFRGSDLLSEVAIASIEAQDLSSKTLNLAKIEQKPV